MKHFVKKIYKLSKIWLASIVISIFIISTGTATIRSLLIPFTVEPASEKSLSTRILHMIAFTFMNQPGIRIVHHAPKWTSEDILKPIFQQEVAQSAQDQNCSYVIYGSVSLFGKQLSINAVLLNSKNQSVIYATSGLLDQVDDLPKWLDAWLETAITKMTHHEICQIKGQSVKTTNVHIHNIKNEIIGMDIADINNENINEILLYSAINVTAYDRKFNEIASVYATMGKTIIYARWLPFRSCLVISETSGTDILSTIYQWKNNQFSKIKTYSGWFISDLASLDTIVAQNRRYTDYWGPIMKMNGTLNHLLPDPFPIPISTHIFRFTFFHVNKTPFLVAFDKNDKLVVHLDNQLLWRSSQPFGGSLNFIDVQQDTGDIDDYTRQFIPSRLLTCNIDSDPSDELIVCENRSMSGRLFEKSRWFSEGVVHILKWTGSEMQTIWTSKKQPGPVTGYDIEISKTSSRMWITSVLKQHSFFRNGLSRVVSYELLLE